MMYQLATGLATKRARIERRTITSDSMGTFTESWALVTNLPCYVGEVSAQEAERYRRDGVSATHRIQLDGSATIREADRVSMDGLTFDVLAVLNPGRAGARLVLICEQVR